jgi:hypothetical protein
MAGHRFSYTFMIICAVIDFQGDHRGAVSGDPSGARSRCTYMEIWI